jgi:ferrous iron transport protein A
MNKQPELLKVIDTESLADLPLQRMAQILSVGGDRALRRRLMELGLVPGTPVKVVNVAPLGDPLELSVRGCRLSIRRKQAKALLIRKSA